MILEKILEKMLNRIGFKIRYFTVRAWSTDLPITGRLIVLQIDSNNYVIIGLKFDKFEITSFVINHGNYFAIMIIDGVRC
jgi:hypothetical protein